MYLLNQLKQNLSRMNHMLTMISWNLFYPRLHDGFNILCKNIENELRLPLSTGSFLIAHAWSFIMLYFSEV